MHQQTESQEVSQNPDSDTQPSSSAIASGESSAFQVTETKMHQQTEQSDQAGSQEATSNVDPVTPQHEKPYTSATAFENSSSFTSVEIKRQKESESQEKNLNSSDSVTRLHQQANSSAAEPNQQNEDDSSSESDTELDTHITLSHDDDGINESDQMTASGQTDFRSRMPNFLSEEEINFLRLCRLVYKIAPQAIRCRFDLEFPPQDLDGIIKKHLNTLTELKRKRVITLTQWNLLLPYGSAAISSDFDVSLMICLFRHLTSIAPQSGDYDRLPPPSDESLGADLARVKYHRNRIAHFTERTIDNSDFPLVWEELSKAVGRIGGHKYEQECNSLLLTNLDPSHMDIYREFLMSEVTMKEKMEAIEKTLKDTVSPNERGIYSGWKSSDTFNKLQEMLKDDSYECYWNRIYLVGNYGVGKTTLAKLLVNDPIPKTWESTDGIGIYIGRAGMDVEKQKWVPLKKGIFVNAAFMSMLKRKGSRSSKSEIILKNVTRKKDKSNYATADTAKTENKKAHWFVDDPRRSDDLPYGTNDQEGIKQYESKGEEISDEEILDLIRRELRKGDYKMILVPIDIWDFGGQKIYYMTHQLFISSRGTFVIVFNGSFDLNTEIEDLSFLPGHKDKNTYAGYIMHWVNSILTFCDRTRTRDGIVYPRILFVATHKDMVENVFTCRERLKQSLHDLFKSHAGYQHLMIDQLFFINAKNEKDDVLDALRQELVDVAFRHPLWGERMPTKFVPLELQLSKRSDAGKKIIPFTEVQNINEKNKTMAMSPSQLNTFLKTEHALGKLVYFDEDHLREYVIVDPSYLIEVLRSIITQKPFWPKGEHLRDIFTKLSTTGMLTKSDIFKIWEQGKFEHVYPFKEYMINILVRLDIMLQPNTNFSFDKTNVLQDEETYFLVPCMITERPLQNIFDKDKCIFMAYKFTEQIIPPALLYRFLASFLSMRNMNINKDPCDLILFTDSAIVTIDKNHKLQAHVQENRLVVTLMHTQSKAKIEPDIAATAQECLTRNIVRTSDFYSTIANTQSGGIRRFPFTIELGIDCETKLCFFNHNLRLPESRGCWTCPRHKITHDMRSSYLWFSDKAPTVGGRCLQDCKGPEISWLQKCPSLQHIRRLGASLSPSDAKKLYINFDIPESSFAKWERYEYSYWRRDPVDMFTVAFQDCIENVSHPSFQTLLDVMEKAELDECIICNIIREIKCPVVLSREGLARMPSNQVLEDMSHVIGSATFQLGIELGLDLVTLKNIENIHKELSDQTRQVLKVWKSEICPKRQVRYPTETLAKALQRVGRLSSVAYLEEEFMHYE